MWVENSSMGLRSKCFEGDLRGERDFYAEFQSVQIKKGPEGPFFN